MRVRPSVIDTRPARTRRVTDRLRKRQGQILCPGTDVEISVCERAPRFSCVTHVFHPCGNMQLPDLDTVRHRRGGTSPTHHPGPPLPKTNLGLAERLLRHAQGDQSRAIAKAVLRLMIASHAGGRERAKPRTAWRKGWRDRGLLWFFGEVRRRQG